MSKIFLRCAFIYSLVCVFPFSGMQSNVVRLIATKAIAHIGHSFYDTYQQHQKLDKQLSVAKNLSFVKEAATVGVTLFTALGQIGYFIATGKDPNLYEARDIADSVSSSIKKSTQDCDSIACREHYPPTVVNGAYVFDASEHFQASNTVSPSSVTGLQNTFLSGIVECVRIGLFGEKDSMPQQNIERYLRHMYPNFSKISTIEAGRVSFRCTDGTLIHLRGKDLADACDPYFFANLKAKLPEEVFGFEQSTALGSSSQEATFSLNGNGNSAVMPHTCAMPHSTVLPQEKSVVEIPLSSSELSAAALSSDIPIANTSDTLPASTASPDVPIKLIFSEPVEKATVAKVCDIDEILPIKKTAPLADVLQNIATLSMPSIAQPEVIMPPVIALPPSSISSAKLEDLQKVVEDIDGGKGFFGYMQSGGVQNTGMGEAPAATDTISIADGIAGAASTAVIVTTTGKILLATVVAGVTVYAAVSLYDTYWACPRGNCSFPGYRSTQEFNQIYAQIKNKFPTESDWNLLGKADKAYKQVESKIKEHNELMQKTAERAKNWKAEPQYKNLKKNTPEWRSCVKEKLAKDPKMETWYARDLTYTEKEVLLEEIAEEAAQAAAVAAATAQAVKKVTECRDVTPTLPETPKGCGDTTPQSVTTHIYVPAESISQTYVHPAPEPSKPQVFVTPAEPATKISDCVLQAEQKGITVEDAQKKWGSSSLMDGFQKRFKELEGKVDTTRLGSYLDNPNSGLKEVEQAEKMWQGFRSRSDDIEKIAKNTGFSEECIKEIKLHVFYKTLIKRYEIAPFDADYDIAQAWNRLINNQFVKSDLELLRHELAESMLMNNQAMAYDPAHELVEKFFNWRQSL